MTEDSDLPPDPQIRRYLELAAQARKHAQSPYAGLFAAIPPDPQTTMIKELAIVYVIVGALLLVVALISLVQTLFGNLNGSVVRAA